METRPLLETRNLKKYFKLKGGILHAVDNINLEIYPNKTLCVVGESGCGKTTLGRTILRLIEPSSGEIIYDGKNIAELNNKAMRNLRKDMQLIFQDPYSSINPRMTVSEIIAEYMIVHKVYKSRQEIWRRTLQLMDLVGLASRLADAYPHELDGGRRQRIGIARALSLNPRFIVCDEPVSALDVSIQAQILNLLMDLQDEMNLTYMFITHNMSVVRHIANDIAVMYLGQCVEKAPADEIFDSPRHPYTKALLAAIPEADIRMRNKELKTIKGEITSPIDPKPGCRFAPRCEYVTEACITSEPEFRHLGDEHYCSCINIEK